MKNGISMAIAVFVLAGSTPAFPAGIGPRPWNQQQRIHQGVHGGSLTPREAARLGRELFRTERLRRRLRADGDFTCRDRARIHHRLHRSSRHMDRAKRNDRRYPYPFGNSWRNR